MNLIKEILKPLASLKLTVTLLAFAMIVVFTGTTAQKEMGIWTVQSKYFHTFISEVPLKNFFPLSKWCWEHIPLKDLPARRIHTAGTAAGESHRSACGSIKISLKRSGILLVHGGLILLLVGEIVTSLFQVESNMQIDTGQTVSYSYDLRNCELAVIDPSGAQDKVTVIGSGLLRNWRVHQPL